METTIHTSDGTKHVTSNPSSPTTTATTIINSHKRESTHGSTASALRYLLREDPLLSELNLTSLEHSSIPSSPSSPANTNTDQPPSDDHPSFAYAAALINADNSWISPGTTTEDPHGTGGGGGDIKRKAEEALVEVDQKLALVESLAERISREKPEHVAGPLLRLHGYSVSTVSDDGASTDDDGTTIGGASAAGVRGGGGGDSSEDNVSNIHNNASGTTLVATRERCLRLSRQAAVLDSVSRRVETTLVRGLTRMEAATTKLERVLRTGRVLKMIMRLRFEARKVGGSGFDFGVLTEGDCVGDESSASTGGGGETKISGGGGHRVDLRDLTRAAASVAVMEELLRSPELETHDIDVVTKMRPEGERVARSVRKAAAGLLEEPHDTSSYTSSSSSLVLPGTSGGTGTVPSATRLGATLQVYFHLGELPDATWKAVGMSLDRAEKAAGLFLNPSAVRRLVSAAGKAVDVEVGTTAAAGSTSSLSASDAVGDRTKTTTKSVDGSKRGVSSTSSSSSSSLSSSHPRNRERTLKRNLREGRAEAASRWAECITEAASQVWNLHRVLSRKSDPVSRQNFLDVVNAAPVPEKFRRGLGNSGVAATTAVVMMGRKNASVFTAFWNQMCRSLGDRIRKLLSYDNGSIAEEVVAYYPAVRAAALDMLNSIRDMMQAGTVFTEDTTASGGGGVGILGGSAGLDDAVFLGWSSASLSSSSAAAAADRDAIYGTEDESTNGRTGVTSVGADSWTKVASTEPSSSSDPNGITSLDRRASGGFSKPSAVSQTSSALSSILSSPEWLALQGSSSDHFSSPDGTHSTEDGTGTGLYPLQRRFLRALDARLLKPLDSLFLENSVVDENGISLSVLPTLPTAEDMGRLETVLREELSLADPREGGGESSMATMISERIVDTVEKFCAMAEGAMSGVKEEKMLDVDGKPGEGLLHDMKVAEVVATLAASLRALPENTFVVPYRPAHSLQHEEAANMCQIALLPALHEIESLIKTHLLDPLCRVLNARVSTAIGKMHRGVYLEGVIGGGPVVGGDGSDGETSFVRDHLVDVYENIGVDVLSRLPSEYADAVASTVATFSIYCFVSNATLVRPLGEMGRLRVTQDLADFELTLEQLLHRVVIPGGEGGGDATGRRVTSSSSVLVAAPTSTATLAQLSGGKPYAELRAVRQMLFWNGLEDANLTASRAAKAFLREPWVKDVRASTAFHFLLSFAPRLLSSPHHSARMGAEEYCRVVLVKPDGSIEDGEGRSWITTMACCEAYNQRESVDGGGNSGVGDKRIASILMVVGPELLRRKRH